MMGRDPPDPGGGTLSPDPANFSTPPIRDSLPNSSTTNRKRTSSIVDSSLPIKKTTSNTSLIPSSNHSTYIHPEHSDKKLLYSDSDEAPFLVHVTRSVGDISSGTVLSPIKFGHFLFSNKIKNIIADGVKRVGRNRISVEFKSGCDANSFLSNPALSHAKYSASIPSYTCSRMGIVRGVPVEWSLEDIVNSIRVPSGFGSITRARRLNKKSHSEENSISYIPTQSVVLTFKAQKLPSHVYCFYTSLPVEPYILPSIQCQKCCRFGHIASQCRSKPRCFVCAQSHEGDSCSNISPSCLFCSGSHTAKDPICPEHSRQKSIKIVMSQENISYFEASARFPSVRRSFADSLKSAVPSSQQYEPIINSGHHTFSNAPSSISHRKTVFIPRHPYAPASSHPYDKQAHFLLTQTPSSSLPNGSAYPSGPSKVPPSPLSDNLLGYLITSLINILTHFSDSQLPEELKKPLSELANVIHNVPSTTAMELSQH